MPRFFWSPNAGPSGMQSQALLPGQNLQGQIAVPVDSTDVVWPAPGSSLLRVPAGGGPAQQLPGTINGQLAYFDSGSGLWLPTPTGPADGNMAQWDAAASTWKFVTPPNPGALAYFDNTFSPVGLWNFNGTLADTSGNFNNLILAAGNAGFADVVPGKQGVFVWQGARYSTNGFPSALRIPGDLTIETIIQQDVNPISSNQQLIAFGGAGETQAENTMYTLNIQATGAFTTTRNLQFDSETGAGVNNTYSSSGTAASLGCIHNILFLAVTRLANVIQFYVNGRPFAPPSAAFPTPDGGNTATCRFTVGAATGTTAADQILVFGAKVINRALTAAEVKSEYNRTMGPAFGVIP